MKNHKKNPSFQSSTTRSLRLEERRLESKPYRHAAYFWLTLGVIVTIAIPAYFIFKPKPATNTPTKTLDPITSVEKPVAKPITKMIPSSFDIAVPYAPQAPLSNWAVHEESCEEAAIYMYKGFLDKTAYPSNRIPDKEADSVFRTMKTWQVSHYGKEPDLTMTALGTFASSYYGYTPTVKKSITADTIKEAVSNGHPVIVPVMTHSLENSMYGPISVYHVLLIKGYDATGVITNDAGVGNGVNKHYSWEVLWQAIDAQTAKMNQGREMLYLTK